MTEATTFLRVRIPPVPLREYIEVLWYFDGPKGPHAREYVLPTGAAALIVDLRGGRPRAADGGPGWGSGCVVAGPSCEPLVLDTAHEARRLGVEFRPGGARPFLGLPVGELANRRVDLEAVVGRGASGLRERLLEAGGEPRGALGVEARFRVVEAALLRWLGGGPAPRPAVREAVRRLDGSPLATPHVTPNTARIARLAADVGLSPRRFTQVFADAVGLTPKRYGRVRRFHEVLRRVAGRGEADWAGLAAACGYYDQPHLIREFVALAGVTPVAYLERRGAYANHVRLS